jgi:hypothetical protein
MTEQKEVILLICTGIGDCPMPHAEMFPTVEKAKVALESARSGEFILVKGIILDERVVSRYRVRGSLGE